MKDSDESQLDFFIFYESGRWDHHARKDRKIIGSIGDEGLPRVAV